MLENEIIMKLIHHIFIRTTSSEYTQEIQLGDICWVKCRQT